MPTTNFTSGALPLNLRIVIDLFGLGFVVRLHPRYGKLKFQNLGAQMFSPQRQPFRGRRFEKGVTVLDDAEQSLSRWEIDSGLGRHEKGDWGEVDAERRKKNEEELQHPAEERAGFEIRSLYTARSGIKFEVI